ncbi:MAG: hypothetical protein K0Q73_5440 [Paenibacillus sp.]|nr:hypothetical protein [Paenibacillus sp.]
MENHIIFTSGGIASLSVCDWVKEQYPNDNILMYFTDTLCENEDCYRIIDEGSDKLQLPLLTHSLGINPMRLMFEKKMVYNSMIGDCSKILKMQVARDFLKKGKLPAIEKWRNAVFLKDRDFITDATLYFGIGYEEMHRAPAIEANWQPFKVEFPLIDNNINKDDVLKKWDIKRPILYDYGFSHNNCNGRCVKAGQGHYKLLKDQMPDVFEKIMEQEHHLKMCVSAYRYITKGNKPKDDIPPEDVIPLHVQEVMLKELDNAYRDYFYDQASKHKLYIHPAGSAVHR